MGGQWWDRGVALLREALDAAEDERGSVDVSIGSSEAAIVCFRIAQGERPASDMDGYDFPGEEPDESGCVCTAEMRATGGFRSRCPVHGNGSGSGARA